MANWITRMFSNAEIKSNCVTIPLPKPLSDLLRYGHYTAATPAGAKALYCDSSAVSIPVNFIAEAFSSLTPVIKIGKEIIRDHPILDLLASPSPFYSTELLLEMLGKDFLITGEVGIVGLGNINRPPLELQPIGAENITHVEGALGYANLYQVTGQSMSGVYEITRKNNAVKYYSGNLRELKLIRNYSPKNNSLLRGESPLVSAAKEVRQHILGNTHNCSLLENGGRVSLVFHFGGQFNMANYEATKERVQAQYGGASKAGAIGVTAGGDLDIKELGTNNKDMDYAALHNIARQAVALQYKFPLPLITVDAATMNNYAVSKLAAFDDAVLPLGDKIFGGLTEFLMPRFALDPAKVKITYDMDEITALATRRNEELKMRASLGIETDNELRAMIGREPYDNGDIIYKPANMIPAGTDIYTDDEPIKPNLVRDTD